MGGRLATGLEKVSIDLSSLREGGFWAIVGTFESNWILAKFREVQCADLPKSESWQPVPLDSWQSTANEEQYVQYVNAIKEHIAMGDVYQVNACRILNAIDSKNPSLLPLANAIQNSNPAPFASYLSLPGLEIASASPERFLSLSNGTIMSSPIKGTSASEEFLAKDEAENLMIVDLIRNDIGAVAKTGTVTTPRLLDTEAHPGLFHLVSDVQGEIAENLDFVDVLENMMPPGSVSGAPKSSALQIIEKYEGQRGPYCGAIGWYDGNCAQIAVGIRTFWRGDDQVLKFGTGAGITWDSDPHMEWQETELKARRLINIASGVVR